MDFTEKYTDRISVGITHLHTENSVDDSTLSVERACERLKELGASVAFISDHGTCMGFDDFYEATKKAGLKPIYGVECYYRDSLTNGRAHLVLYAKNNEGLREIYLAMSRATTEQNAGTVYTVLDESNLSFFKGGNVIATSACIQGVLAVPYLFNIRIAEKLKDVEETLGGCDNEAKKYEDKIEDYENAEIVLKEAERRLKEAKSSKATSFAMRERTVKSLKKKLADAEKRFSDYCDKGTGFEGLRKAICAIDSTDLSTVTPDSVQDALEAASEFVNRQETALENDVAAVKQLALEIPQMEIDVEEARKKRDDLKAERNAANRQLNKINKLREKATSTEDKRLDETVIREEIDRRIRLFKSVFGDDFYIELQYHGIAAEEVIYPLMYNYAKQYNVPVVAANDVHTATNSYSDLFARAIRRSCRFKKWEDPQPGDNELYIKTDRELAEALSRILPEEAVDEAMANVKVIADKCDAQIVKASHAPKADIASVKDEVVRIARSNINSKYGKNWTPEYEKRFEYEVDIIDRMGFMDYFYITWDIINEARRIGGLSYAALDELKGMLGDISLGELNAFIDSHPSEVNLSVGLGRGSGAGSMVCFLLGITNVDPMKYNLLFERFLNPERVSMPDIDTDFRTDIKDVLITYLKLRYGDRAIAQILTKSRLQGKSAIDKTAMILGDRDGTSYRYIAEKLKNKSNSDFSKTLAENRDNLLNVCENKREREIAETAIMLEGNLDHTGLHAAGCIISDNKDLAEYIPVAWDIGSSSWKTQCDMVQCEKLHGLLKMDLLLLRTLDIITYTLRLLSRTRPDVSIDVENLPIESEVIKAIYAKGDTGSVFQFESNGMVKNLIALKPDSIDDLIAMNAMYRPGPIDSIPDYIDNKFSGKIVCDCPQLEPILKDTNGIIVFQEQVMQIFRDLAGYSIGRSDLVRRAMAKKHFDELVAERQNFVYGNKAEGIYGCAGIGISEAVANLIFDKMLKFASYAFNKAHAAAYSLTSYITAYLKYYYPTEFFTAVLNYTEKIEDIPTIVKDMERHGIRLLRPDINNSDVDFKPEGGNIRYGLGKMKGAGDKMRTVVNRRGKGYGNLKALFRSDVGASVYDMLVYSGACDSFVGNDFMNRSRLHQEVSDLLKLQTAGKKAREKYNAGGDKTQLEDLSRDWLNYTLMDYTQESRIELLNKEHELTLVYLSGNPLDEYTRPKGCTDIAVAQSNGIERVTLFGFVSDEDVVKTRKDSKKMMMAKLTDYSGSVDFVVFPQNYERYADILGKKAVQITGKLSVKDDKYQLILDSAKALSVGGNRRFAIEACEADVEHITDVINNGYDPDGTEVFMLYRGLLKSCGRVTEQYLRENGIAYICI